MKNLYRPSFALITQIKKFSSNTTYFEVYLEHSHFRLADGLSFVPGQFVMAGLWGFGEAPLGLCSSPFNQNKFSLCFREAGNLTQALGYLKVGDKITVRGPFGNGFPLDKMRGKDIILTAGGTGIIPLASLVEYILTKRKNFGQVHLLYGARTPDDLLFKDRYRRWEKSIELCLTVDEPTPYWHGSLGLVSDLCHKIEVEPENTLVIMCGPGPMYKVMNETLVPLGVLEKNIYVSLERRMRCGIGKCQHCTAGDEYVCLNGPVFRYDKIKNNFD